MDFDHNAEVKRLAAEHLEYRRKLDTRPAHPSESNPDFTMDDWVDWIDSLPTEPQTTAQELRMQKYMENPYTEEEVNRIVFGTANNGERKL